MIAKISRPKTLAYRYLGSLLVAMAVNVLVGTAPAPAQPYVAGGFMYAVKNGQCYKTNWGGAALDELKNWTTNYIHWSMVPMSECQMVDYLVLVGGKWTQVSHTKLTGVGTGSVRKENPGGESGGPATICGSGFYYMPGTDVCLAGKKKNKGVRKKTPGGEVEKKKVTVPAAGLLEETGPSFSPQQGPAAKGTPSGSGAATGTKSR